MSTKFKLQCSHKSECSTLSVTATLTTGSFSIDSRELDDVVNVVRADNEVSGGGIGSEFIILYVVTISKLGVTRVVTSERSAESTEVDVPARVGNC